ncbi:MAG: YceI family protein [Blastocatellia bacterium]
MSSDETAVIRYIVDASQSKFTVQAFATGLLSGFGHNPTIAIRDYTGEVQCTQGFLTNASVRLETKTDSLIVIDDVKEKDRQEIESLMHSTVLETARYPEILFQSTNITVTRIAEGRYKARIIGELTLHGVTRGSLWIHAQVKVTEGKMRAQGEFTLKQTDYNIKRVSVAGGALRLKDELKFTFDMLANQEQA